MAFTALPNEIFSFSSVDINFLNFRFSMFNGGISNGTGLSWVATSKRCLISESLKNDFSTARFTGYLFEVVDVLEHSIIRARILKFLVEYEHPQFKLIRQRPHPRCLIVSPLQVSMNSVTLDAKATFGEI